jgi:TRAP-type C4-dicarboxylate transport system substrate-binding protein
MNKATWNQLPPEYQKVIEETAAALPAKHDAIQLREYVSMQKEIAEEYPKTRIYHFSPEELVKFKKAAVPVRAEFINELNKKGLPGDKLMKTFHELEKKYASETYEKYDY